MTSAIDDEQFPVSPVDRLKARYAADTQSVALLGWLEPRPSAVFKTTELAAAIGVTTRRAGQLLGNLAHVQSWHALNVLVRIGKTRHGKKHKHVSLWRWAGVDRPAQAATAAGGAAGLAAGDGDAAAATAGEAAGEAGGDAGHPARTA